MAEDYLSLPLSVWINELAGFLTVSDILALRRVHKLSSKFITKVCTALVSSLDSRIEQVQTSLGTEVKERIDRALQLELSAKKTLNSIQIDMRDIMELKCLRSPPPMVADIFELLICLALNKQHCTWDTIPIELTSDFFQSAVEKFNSEEVRLIPEHLHERSNTLTIQEAARISTGGARALQLVQAYIALQDVYHSPEAEDLIRQRKRVNNLRLLQRVCAKVSQGIPETSHHPHESYLSLPLSFWIHEMSDFLTVSDLLSLRCVEKRSSAFVSTLCTALVSSIDIEQVKSSLSTEARERTERFIQQEQSARNVINSIRIDPRDIAELKAFSYPPSTVERVLELVICLAFNKKDCNWSDAKKQLSNPSGFCQAVMEKFNSEEIRPIPKRLRSLANNLTVPMVLSVSKSSASLLQQVQAYIALQDIYTSPEAEEFIAMRKRIDYLRERQRICAKVSQGMPETSLHPRKSNQKGKK